MDVVAEMNCLVKVSCSTLPRETFRHMSFYVCDEDVSPTDIVYLFMDRTLDRTPWGGWRPRQNSIVKPCVDEMKHFMDALELSPLPPPISPSSSPCSAAASKPDDGSFLSFNRDVFLNDLISGLTSSLRSKVFGIGMYRTCTSRLGQALSWLNYKTTFNFIPVQGFRNLDYFDIASSRWIHDALPQVEPYLQYLDAFTDCPWMYLYKEMDTRFPNARFILTVRSSSRVVAESEMAQWKRLGLDKQLLEETDVEIMVTKEMFMERYEKHNRAVLEYFEGREKGKLLILCLEAEEERAAHTGGQGAWQKLCTFLGGLTVPDLPFPHVNQRL